MVPDAGGASVELWTRYDGVARASLTCTLLLMAAALLILALRLHRPLRAPRYPRSCLVVLIVVWPVSIAAFLVALGIYVAQLTHDYPSFVAPQSPILPVTLSAAVASFALVVLVGPGKVRDRLVAAGMAAAAAPMIFELPFDLMVMARTTPPVLPDPGWWRTLFFAPLVVVELVTIALFLAVPAVEATRWTWVSLSALFLAFALWAAGGLGYPDHTVPHLWNVVAKLLAFAVALSMLVPVGRTTRSAEPV